MITIPITFCMLIAKYLCLLKPFWLRKNNKTSVLLIIIILAMILGVVKIQVWLNDWNNDFFNALSQKETDKLWQLVLWFPALLGIFVLISVNKTWLIKLLTIRWREWLTDYYLNRWFADKNYYFTQIYGEHKNTDNPDQRIAEDILLLISKTLSLSFGFIQSLSMLITFTVILWQSAGTLSFTVGGTEWNIQGYMVYTVVLIVIGGTLFTHKVGKPLTRATDNASVTVKEQNEPVAQVSQWKRYDSRTPVNLATRMALDAFNVALAKDLRVNIREQASGAYSVSSRLSVDPQAKDISHLLAFTCQPERHDELLTLANEVMVKRLAKGISEQELNEYQQNVQRSLDIQQRSVQQLANTIVNSLIQYDDPAAWTEQEQLLKQMTVENVNTAVKQYLSHPVNTYTGVLLPK